MSEGQVQRSDQCGLAQEAAGPVMRRIEFLGEAVSVSLPDAGMAESVVRLYGAHCTPLDSVDQADITVLRTSDPDPSESGIIRGTNDDDTLAYRMIEPGAALGMGADPRLCDRRLLGSVRTLAEVRERVQYRVIAEQGRHLMFHGAVAVRDGLAVLFPGQSGAGKTTLSAWLIGQGFTVLSDELVAVDEGYRATGFGQALNLKRGSVDLVRGFPWLAQAFESAIPSGVGGCFLPCVAGSATPRWYPLKAVVFPTYKGSEPFAATRLSSGRAVQGLMESLLNARNFERLAIPRLSAMAAALPAHQVVYDSLLPMANWLEGVESGSD
jgi:hypothetical protein